MAESDSASACKTMTSNAECLSNDFQIWLDSNRLGILYDGLVNEGFDTKEDFENLNENDLEKLWEKMKIDKIGIEKRFYRVFSNVSNISPMVIVTEKEQETIDKITKMINCATNMIQQIKSKTTELSEMKKNCDNAIKMNFAQLHEKLEQREKYLMQESNTIYEHKQKQLNEEENMLASQMEELESQLKQCRQSLQANVSNKNKVFESSNDKLMQADALMKDSLSCNNIDSFIEMSYQCASDRLINLNSIGNIYQESKEKKESKDGNSNGFVRDNTNDTINRAKKGKQTKSENENEMKEHIEICIDNNNNNNNNNKSDNNDNSIDNTFGHGSQNNNENGIVWKDDEYYLKNYDLVATFFGSQCEDDTSRPEPDAKNDVLIYDGYGYASRFDKVSKSWRKRGRGMAKLFYNKEKCVIILQFEDQDHSKIRLLQTFYPFHDFQMKIDKDEGKNTISWYNIDCVMPKKYWCQEMWKITFMTDENGNNSELEHILQEKTFEFLNIVKDFYFGLGLPTWCEKKFDIKIGSTKPRALNNFENDSNHTNMNNNETFLFGNGYNGNNNNDNNNSNENEACEEYNNDEAKEKDDNNDNNDKMIDKNESDFNIWLKSQWQNESQEQPNNLPKFAFGGGFDGFAKSNVFSNASWNTGDTDNANKFSSFGDTNFSMKDWTPSDSQSNNDKNGYDNNSNELQSNNNNNNNNNDEDYAFNGKEYTLSAIVNVNKQNVPTGHENERLIGEMKFKKLYRFGIDGTGDSQWKDRATQSKIYFYQNNKNGKIRAVARELKTQKLRLNQFIPSLTCAEFNDTRRKFYTWKANDMSIAKEEPDNGGIATLFGIRFYDEKTAKEFRDMFRNCAESNAAIADSICN